MLATLVDNEAYIVAYARTPIGSFRGSLAPYSAVELGAHAVQAAFKRCEPLFLPSDVDTVYFGNVISAGLGQNVARQIAISAGIPHGNAPATTVNKVCASGMKAIALAVQSIRLGEAHVAIAGGTESMSNAPHLLASMRSGVGYGEVALRDAIAVDGLTDAFNVGMPMGLAAESSVRRLGISREAQDAFTLESYDRAALAYQSGHLRTEIAPISASKGVGVGVGVGASQPLLDNDEEVAKLRREKVASLRPAFDKAAGTITAANASSLADGAAAVLLASGAALRAALSKAAGGADKASFDHANIVLYHVRSYGEAEQDPIRFAETPSLAVKSALVRARVLINDVDIFEINEAFACVPLANMAELAIDHARVNVLGGAVAMGHPLGCSGARIVCTLCTALATFGKRIGCASVCNGGGGASALVIERVSLAD